MVKVPGVPDNADMLDMLKVYPSYLAPLMTVFDNILRNKKSELTVGQLELIAAYVGSLNKSSYIVKVHSYVANAFGVETKLIEKLMDDLSFAPIDPKLLPLFLYVKKLTLTPDKMEQEDVQAILDAGWNNQTIFDVVSVCALASFSSRMALGMGILPEPREDSLFPKEIMREDYSTLVDLIIED